MEDLQVFRVPAGFDRALGRDTARTRKNWDKLVSELSTAPHVMRGVPEESPYIRRFHHQSFLSQRQRGFCFPGETVIRLENKGGAFISNIKVGQEVLGHDNNKHQVTETFKRHYTGSLYILNIKGIEHLLRLTEEHPIGVVESLKDDTITWKAACYVKLGDLVLRPYGDQIPDPKSDYRRHKYGTLHPVEEVNIEEVKNKLVYNFGVDSVNTYIANDCAVHNCVGFNTANNIMTLLRIPLGATANSGTPLPLTLINPLYIYDLSRMVSKEQGINLGNGDGAIGSCAIKGCHKWGVVGLDEYDNGPQAIDNHRNNAVPPSGVIQTGTEHQIEEFSICDSWNHGLEMLGSGFPIMLCSAIPEGMMHTDAKGFFRMVGKDVGGHCYACIDYSKKLNLAWVSQAWEGWGEKTTDPTFTPMHGYTQIGTCPLDELERYFDSRKISGGASEIYVANSVEGWSPKIVDYGPM